MDIHFSDLENARSLRAEVLCHSDTQETLTDTSVPRPAPSSPISVSFLHFQHGWWEVASGSQWATRFKERPGSAILVVNRVSMSIAMLRHGLHRAPRVQPSVKEPPMKLPSFLCWHLLAEVRGHTPELPSTCVGIVWRRDKEASPYSPFPATHFCFPSFSSSFQWFESQFMFM